MIMIHMFVHLLNELIISKRGSHFDDITSLNNWFKYLEDHFLKHAAEPEDVCN